MLGWKPKFNDPQVASVRYRCLNPLQELQRRGLAVELFDERHLSRYSAVVFSKLYDEGSQVLARDLKRRGRGVIFDICDNHFYNPYRLEQFELVRRQLLTMLGLADRVVASTEALARTLMEEAPLRDSPVVVGDAVEEDGLEGPRGRPEGGKATLIWFGIHGGDNAPYGLLDLLAQKDLLVELDRGHPLRLVVVSNSRDKFERHIRPFPIETRYVEWGSSPIGQLLRESDVNLIPISKNPFTLCKTNNRLALALYAGVPTVADEIPSYRDLAPYCVLDEWAAGLQRYLDDLESARRQAAPARAYLKEQYGMDRIGSRWAECLSAYL
jgi:hypothetical protein